jgi:hypothetical protein
MTPEPFDKLAGDDGRLDESEIGPALSAIAPLSRQQLAPLVAWQNRISVPRATPLARPRAGA